MKRDDERAREERQALLITFLKVLAKQDEYGTSEAVTKRLMTLLDEKSIGQSFRHWVCEEDSKRSEPAARIRCTTCRSTKTKVIDGRASKFGFRRRRECLDCGRRFSTRETAVPGRVDERT